ncbi:hypothetical protein Tsp_04703 [Trichinella spiralis]|uniref:hypothetical protein n=1 Tax=Trichinella spiralis TaxID=6334 RepID=UPI0001EFD9DC|nr:hypothetical protein Tsp_04703 [Trichinella spiralis]
MSVLVHHLCVINNLLSTSTKGIGATEISINVDHQLVNGRKGGKAELTRTTSLSKAEYGNYVTCSEFVCSWVIVVPDRSSCDLLRRLLIPRCNKRSKRLSGVCFVTQSN